MNLYLSGLLEDLTAKDFRTWHATVLAAAALAASDEPGDTKASRRRAVKAAVDEVAEYLGNTADHREELLHRPAGDRPLRERHHDRPVHPDAVPISGKASAALEKAVLDLLS